jgi:hypothetical protein
MKKQSLTFEHKLTILLRLGTLSGAYDNQTYYFTANTEALDTFGYSKEDQENFAPFWGDSLSGVVDKSFHALITTYLEKSKPLF